MVDVGYDAKISGLLHCIWIIRAKIQFYNTRNNIYLCPPTPYLSAPYAPCLLPKVRRHQKYFIENQELKHQRYIIIFFLYLLNLQQNMISNITMTDREIIYILRSGQYEMAFNALVKQYSERLYWHVRRFLCCHEDTDDLLQDIFVKIWKGLPSFRADSQIFTWIYRIATNEVLNHLRKGRILSVIRLDSPAENLIRKIDDDPYFNGDALQRELQKAIQKLPDKQKLVFNLRYFDEMKYEEISEITGTSVGALKASYHHAYNKLKAELEEKFIDK